MIRFFENNEEIVNKYKNLIIEDFDSGYYGNAYLIIIVNIILGVVIWVTLPFLFLYTQIVLLLRGPINLIYHLIFKKFLIEREEKRRVQKEILKILEKEKDILNWVDFNDLNVKDYSLVSHYKFNRNTENGKPYELRDCNYKSFIYNLFHTLYYNYDTVDSSNRLICDTHRRRSIGDTYSIVKHYFPEVTFEDVLKVILTLIEDKVIYGSFCTDVRKYVFYTKKISYHTGYDHYHIENTRNITFKDVMKYYKLKENDKKN